jgi:hypothetical protein
MKRSQQFFLAMILFVLVLFAILAITDQWMISKTIETCPAQFPKWIGCVLANHENLSGSLITAGGALFAEWIAWRAVMDQIESDKALARSAERPIVHEGPGWRRQDAHGRHEGIVFTGQNTGKTTAFPKEIYWGACAEDEWSTIGKNWPQIETAKHEKWETPLPPNMTNDKLIGAEFTSRRSLTMGKITSATERSFTPTCMERSILQAGSIRWCVMERNSRLRPLRAPTAANGTLTRKC